MRSVRSLLVVCFATVLAVVGVAVPTAQSGATAPAAATPKPITVVALSNRPDLVSGNDVTVLVRRRAGLSLSKLTVTLNGRSVTRRFVADPNGRRAYLPGLRRGANTIIATAPGFRGRLVVTNHGDGPVFTGPRAKYYRCQESAVDANCQEPVRYTFLYKSSNPTKTGLQPYNRKNPPDDVAQTTTDNGVTVPFIVRREDGFQNRDRYTILTLSQPGKPFLRGQPQPQVNRKILVTHGGGCGASYAPGSPPLEDYSGTIPEGTPGQEQSYVVALGQGFSVISTALDNTGHNCNVAANAESVMMAKEHFVERYGAIRYTIGTGCSGGSIAQHTVANAYPGIYQGLVTTCSYPDTFTAGAQFADYHLLRLYFENPDKWGEGVVWSPTQFAAVEGHLSHANAVVADEGLFKAALDPENDCSGTVDPVAGDPSTRYDSEINPGGVRCSVLDLLAAPLGRRPESVWTPQEQAAGHGFGGVPFSNDGVLYGLNALKSGQITAAQFVDLNVKVGGLDIDSQPAAERIHGDPASVANAYRTGHINETNNLDNVPIINFGGPDPGIAHDYAHAFWTEDRLMRDQGHTDNRVMWFGAAPLIGDPGWATEAMLAMDRWLTNIERDSSTKPLSQKVIDDKPADVTDRCSNVPGVGEIPGEDGEPQCVLPEEAQTRLSTPREVAGGDRFNDVVDCQLTPLDRSTFTGLATLTDEQFATLEDVFPDGVCDYAKQGTGQQGAQTWLSYFSGNGTGDVVYGGRNLPGVAPYQGDGLQSPGFRALLRQ